MSPTPPAPEFTEKELAAMRHAVSWYFRDTTHEGNPGLPKSDPDYRPLKSALKKLEERT